MWGDQTWPDNWTSVTQDGKLSAQFEQTMVVTDTGVEVLPVNLTDLEVCFLSLFSFQHLNLCHFRFWQHDLGNDTSPTSWTPDQSCDCSSQASVGFVISALKTLWPDLLGASQQLASKWSILLHLARVGLWLYCDWITIWCHSWLTNFKLNLWYMHWCHNQESSSVIDSTSWDCQQN